MTENKNANGRKVLVTGSRGKSSIVRMLHTALQDAGHETYARITGVLPRELGPDGVRIISRSCEAHVEEMRWWLNGLPGSAQAIVLENSAITLDLQGLAGRWLRPDMTVLSNTSADHQEVWGPGKDNAAEVLCSGIPAHGKVILPVEMKTDNYLLELLERRSCKLVFTEPAFKSGNDFRSINLGLALGVIEQLGLNQAPGLQAMLNLQVDRYDFQVLQCAGAELAMAFSVNDITSTRAVFQSLNWNEQETRLIYNHRNDRPGRFRSFIDWLNNSPWREVLIIGDRPRRRSVRAQYLDIKNEKELRQLFKPGDRIFGCGNIAGLPLSLITTLY